jgi:hypothetical protein
MKVRITEGDKINGWEINRGKDELHYVATKENLSITFYTEAGGGRNYSKVVSIENRETNRKYYAQRFFLKYVSLVQSFSNALFDKYQFQNEPKCKHGYVNCVGCGSGVYSKYRNS